MTRQAQRVCRTKKSNHVPSSEILIDFFSIRIILAYIPLKECLNKNIRLVCKAWNAAMFPTIPANHQCHLDEGEHKRKMWCGCHAACTVKTIGTRIPMISRARICCFLCIHHRQSPKVYQNFYLNGMPENNFFYAFGPEAFYREIDARNTTFASTRTMIALAQKDLVYAGKKGEICVASLSKKFMFGLAQILINCRLDHVGEHGRALYFFKNREDMCAWTLIFLMQHADPHRLTALITQPQIKDDRRVCQTSFDHSEHVRILSKIMKHHWMNL